MPEPRRDEVFGTGGGARAAEGALVGFRKTSLVDFPGKVASVLFFPGCNFRCPWCHNRELVLGTADDLIPLDSCLEEIVNRRRLIQGVVITGGEALLRDGIGELVRLIHGMGLPVKLDTNGSMPARLSALYGDPATRPDYIAIDLKTGPSLYGALAAATEESPFQNIHRSLNELVSAGICFELRTVVAPGHMDETTVAELAAIVPDGAPWFFSPFAPGNCLDPEWNGKVPPSIEYVRALVRLARGLGKNAVAR